jgi:ATP-binding cassette, subfamily B, bacterial
MTASRNSAIRDVLAFLFRHWRREKTMVAITAASMAAATGADVLMPLYSGRLIDAIAVPAATVRSSAIHSALHTVVLMACMGALLVAGRHAGFLGIVRLTLLSRGTQIAENVL